MIKFMNRINVACITRIFLFYYTIKLLIYLLKINDHFFHYFITNFIFCKFKGNFIFHIDEF